MTEPKSTAEGEIERHQEPPVQWTWARRAAAVKEHLAFAWAIFRRGGTIIGSIFALGSFLVIVFNYFNAYSVVTRLWTSSTVPSTAIASKDPASAVSSSSSRILVLPLVADDADKTHKLFADGITEDVIAGLSRFPTLQVLGRNTSLALQTHRGNLAALKRTYGIHYVVSGTFRVIADRYRLNIELGDTTVGATLWSERFDGPTPEIVHISDDIVRAIVGHVASELQRIDFQRSRYSSTTKLSAYQLTLQARQLWQRPSRDTLPEAQQLLKRAIEADADYAPAYVYLAYTHLTSYNNAWSPGFSLVETLHEMLKNASQALALDPRYGTAFAAQAIAYVYLGRHAEGQMAAHEALRLNGNDPDTLGRVGQVFSFLGEHEQAIRLLKQAIDLDPFGPTQWFNFLSRAHFFAQDYESAIVNARICLDRAPIEPCRETLAAAFALAGGLSEAANTWKQIVTRRPHVRPEQIGTRLRSAFKRTEDFERLLHGLKLAANAAAQ